MLTPVADGVLVHQSELLRNNTVVVQGPAGVLLVDPGITGAELACLAADLRPSEQPVVAGFSTHPDWDHVLWADELGDAHRYGTARCAAVMREFRADPDWAAHAADALPPELAGEVPLEPFGLLTGLPEGTTSVPWDGPEVRIVEHPAHAEGHAALLVVASRVLAAGDMLSDVLVPFLDLDRPEPVADYLEGLRVLEGLAHQVDVVVPGHGSVGGPDELRRRIDLDRAYVLALRDGRVPDDPRTRPSAVFGSWLPEVSTWQLEQLAARGADREVS